MYTVTLPAFMVPPTAASGSPTNISSPGFLSMLNAAIAAPKSPTVGAVAIADGAWPVDSGNA